ncbi:MAG: SGNH/GDSL hydrolase family protein [Candidatus Eremiobacteraeota bacterium]|nr:SGNH/GDSL hydrolase family protein [Candidatus Eremiobacteraeota bacterium]
MILIVRALIGLLVLVSAMCMIAYAQSKAAPSPIVYVGLGDSITWGLSASKPCLPETARPVEFACPDATSFPAVLARALRSRGHQVQLQNLAISGARIGWVWADELGKIAPTANLITLFIGTNDFSDIAFRNTTTFDQFARQYVSLVDYLRAVFPKARIVLLNVPNIGYLPCCNATRAAAAVTWKAGNLLINALAGKAIVVDLVCDSALYDAAMFPSADSVHPNDAGHARIAADILATLEHPHKPAAACAPYF